jgi:hypothetical protein
VEDCIESCGSNRSSTPASSASPGYSGTLASHGPFTLSCALCHDMAGCFRPQDGPLSCPALNVSACPRGLPPLSTAPRFETRQGVAVVADGGPTLYQCPSRGLVVMDADAASALSLAPGSVVVSPQAGCVPIHYGGLSLFVVPLVRRPIVGVM